MVDKLDGVRVKIKLKQKDTSRLAHKYGLPGNLGNVLTARKIAACLGEIPPVSKRDCTIFLINKIEKKSLVSNCPRTVKIRKAKVQYSRPLVDPNTDAFLQSYEWRRIRMEAIKKYGKRCQCCGATPMDGITQINVDHIKPRRVYPELALDVSNLQVLCNVCNHGKGNWDMTDWREKTESTLPVS